MLQEKYTREQVNQVLCGRDAWQPFPKAGDRQAWAGLLDSPLNQRRLTYLVGQAEALVGQPWQPLPATLYMAYERTGNRRRFEKPYFERREKLAILALAECMEHRGRFLDEIINGLWTICEESTWCVPSHAYPYNLDRKNDALPREDRHIVDLFASQTGFVLAELIYLLGDALDAVSPVVRARVSQEVLQRVVNPVMNCADFLWLTLDFNWNPWCSGNTLGAGLYLLDDDRAADLVWQMMGSTDIFLAGQLADGGCSEGPNYWGVAPGAVLILLEMLYTRSNGAIDIYGEKLIGDLARYFAGVHLDGKWFATFADCPPVVGVRSAAVYRYGQRIGEPSLKNLALLAMRNWQPDGEVQPVFGERHTGGVLNDYVRELWWLPGDAKPEPLIKQRRVWLPDLQVMVARENEQGDQGLVVAAKGGHNQEHHNHNDVGQFVVALDGQVMLADVGIGEYTKKTFSDQRYEIWNIRGSGHNVPVIDGCEQVVGREYAAKDVVFGDSEEGVRLSMDIAGAYDKQAGLKSLKRKVEMTGDEVNVTDQFEIDRPKVSVEVCLFTPGDCEASGDNQLAIRCAGRELVMCCEGVTAEVTDWPLDDERLVKAWGDRLSRIILRCEITGGRGGYTLRFKR